METRRIRRHERRRARRTAVMVTSVAAIGIAVGTALPRSTTASSAVLVAAACCVAVVVLSDPSFAWRFVGTLRTVVGRRPGPVPIVLDEPDDEAEEWWGATVAPVPAPWPPTPPPAPALPAPVLAAPMPSAHVPSRDAHSLQAWFAQLWMHGRRWMQTHTKHDRPSTGEAGAST